MHKFLQTISESLPPAQKGGSVSAGVG